MISWEENVGNQGLMSELFRNIHSFKGNSGFLGYGDMEKLSHKMETVLAGVKDGDELLGEKPENIFLALVDILREKVMAVAGGDCGDIENLEQHIASLQAITKRKLGEILVAEGAVSEKQLSQALTSQEITPYP